MQSLFVLDSFSKTFFIEAEWSFIFIFPITKSLKKSVNMFQFPTWKIKKSSKLFKFNINLVSENIK